MMARFSFRLLVLGILAVLQNAAFSQDGGYEELKLRAAGYYSEKSYQLAHETWVKAEALGVPEGDRQILDFYLADSLWRSRPDAEKLVSARESLTKLGEDRAAGSLSAEAWESLGDSWLAIEGDWSRAWQDYERALNAWAASTDIDRARPRYLGIVWKATGPPGEDYRAQQMPLEVLANALEIATGTEDRARAHFFLGVRMQSGDVYSTQRAGREFLNAVEAGGGTAVYEPALFKLGEWQNRFGTTRWQEDGRLTLEPDFQAALGTFRRFVREFPEGKSEYWASARERIKEITEPSLQLDVFNQYLPGEKPVVEARWRNVGEVKFTLSRVDMIRAFQPTDRTNPSEWLEAVKITQADMVRQWTEAGTDSHAPQQKTVEMEAVTEPGAYVIEAVAGGSHARALVLVTQGAAIIRSVGDTVAAFFCDAQTGERAGAGVATKIWRATSTNDGRFIWTTLESPEVKEGLVRFVFPGGEAGYASVLLLGGIGVQPIVVDRAMQVVEMEDRDWRIQVFTDRAAYRPGDNVRWKLIARVDDEGALRTPGGEMLKFRITDPRGDTIKEGEVRLTEFGGAWGELELSPELALGVYDIQFSREDREIGRSDLFRLEEYRLPEFKIGVSVPADSGVRLGDEFVAQVSAEYYFGGAVADAELAVIVRESPHFRPFPGIEARGKMLPPSGAGRVVVNESVRTGPDGRASVRVRTPFDARGDLRYEIEARVVDSSGREVVGQGSVVVGRQSYFAEVKPSRRVAQPGDAIDLAIVAQDGNDRKVAADGVVTVSRRRWTEVWRSPQGREVTGEELGKLRRIGFPPAGEFGWELIRQEYVSEEISRTSLATNAEGHAAYSFVPGDEGYYRIVWSAPDGDGPPVIGETTVWVSSSAGGMIGYRSGGIEIIVDPEAPAKGGPVPVLITADTSNRDVLFTVNAGNDLFRAEVVHLEGDSRLVMLDSEERFVPNVAVAADSVRGFEVFSDLKDVRFPPFRNTLAMELVPSVLQALPGADAKINLTVKDWKGEPVRGEFAIGVTDEAISYIQEDLAGDPVEFFLGQTRGTSPYASSSLMARPFLDSRQREVRRLQKDRTFSRLPDGIGEDGGFGFGSSESTMDMMVAAAAPVARQAEAPAEPTVQVRSNFNATAFWQPGVLTDADGKATVSFRYPDSLTTWRVVARGATTGASFGLAEVATKTSKPLIARLQMPRFLVAGDSVEASGVINNRTDRNLDAKLDLRVEGLEGAPKSQNVKIEAERDGRAVWKLSAPSVGNARVTLTAVSGDLNDGMATALPVYANGIDKAVSVSGKAVKTETEWTLTIPAERRAGSESLVVTATPSLAAATLDALPYLIRYPYGCVEQTMSRFLPAAVTLNTLNGLGLDRETMANRVFGGIEPEFLAKTHPKMEGAAGLVELDAVVGKGLARLYDFQHEDGAWGWWKHDESDPFMTAYVVWGLRLAQKSGIGVKADVIDRGMGWLRLRLVDLNDEPDRQAWLLHALAANFTAGGKLSAEEEAAVRNLWDKREVLTSYGRALFALAAHGYGDAEKAEVLARNLHDGVTRDDRPDVSQATGVGPADAHPASAGSSDTNVIPTAHWGNAGMFRNWQDGGIEATAFALQALLAINPKDDLVEPAMNWLVKNRRGAQWSNTRDTAITVLAMNAYLGTTKELGAEVGFEIEVNGKKAAEVEKATALGGRSEFTIDRSLLVDGENRILLRRTSGESPVYFSARAEFFTTEEPIPAAGHEVFARRDYFRHAPERTLLDGYRFDRVAWADGEISATNQRVEVVLTIEAKNDLEYLVFEDLKPAGLEAVDVRSGEMMVAEGPDGRTIPVYCELRDRKVALFIRKLPQGVWKIRYDLRTETAGDFSALPVVGHAMYVPEIRCNGESRRILIDAKR